MVPQVNGIIGTLTIFSMVPRSLPSGRPAFLARKMSTIKTRRFRQFIPILVVNSHLPLRWKEEKERPVDVDVPLSRRSGFGCPPATGAAGAGAGAPTGEGAILSSILEEDIRCGDSVNEVCWSGRI